MTLLDRLTALMMPHGPRVQKMFGGTAFLLHENLVIGTHRDGVIVRVGPEAMPTAEAAKGARPMVMGGRSMAGWILVGPEGCEGPALAAWVDQALAFNGSLPPAAARSKAKAKRRA